MEASKTFTCSSWFSLLLRRLAWHGQFWDGIRSICIFENGSYFSEVLQKNKNVRREGEIGLWDSLFCVLDISSDLNNTRQSSTLHNVYFRDVSLLVLILNCSTKSPSLSFRVKTPPQQSINSPPFPHIHTPKPPSSSYLISYISSLPLVPTSFAWSRFKNPAIAAPPRERLTNFLVLKF